MKYSFRFVPGKPPPQDQEVVVGVSRSRQNASASQGKNDLLDVKVVPDALSQNVVLGTPSSVNFTAINSGQVDATGSVLKLSLLVNFTGTAFGIPSISFLGGASTEPMSYAALTSGLRFTSFPVGSSARLVIPVLGAALFTNVLTVTLMPPVGVADLNPVDNTAVTYLTVSPFAGAAAWQQWETESMATDITVGVAERRFSPDIRFCGDGYTQRLDSSGWAVADACPPTGQHSAARWKIKILDYDPDATYLLDIDEAALFPECDPNVFSYSIGGDILIVNTGYGLMGVTVGDGIAASGVVTFTVKKDGLPIAELTMNVQAYPATF